MPRKLPSLLALLFPLATIGLASQPTPPDNAQRIDQVVAHYQELGFFTSS